MHTVNQTRIFSSFVFRDAALYMTCTCMEKTRHPQSACKTLSVNLCYGMCQLCAGSAVPHGWYTHRNFPHSDTQTTFWSRPWQPNGWLLAGVGVGSPFATASSEAALAAHCTALFDMFSWCLLPLWQGMVLEIGGTHNFQRRTPIETP